MGFDFRSTAFGLVTIGVLSRGAAGQSVLDRTPNLSGGWVGPTGTVQFNFLHRFSVGASPARKVSNSPTLLLSYRAPLSLLVGFNYATSSDVAPQFPNEWEVFGRAAPLGVHRGSLVNLALQLGYNQAARSVDGELTLSRPAGPLRLLGVGRYLSHGYDRDTTRYAVGGGATLRLHRNVALAADVATLLDRRPGEKVAWGAALQLVIPYTPHTLSLQVANTSTATLQGASRGTANVRGGFEFTIPFTLNRYFHHAPPPSSPAASAADSAAPQAVVDVRQLAFAPNLVEIGAGGTVAWTNRDELPHTVTADDGAWDSGNIAPGATWRRTFDRPGTYRFHCTPHPFMKGVIVVR
jgi:plastocyanin